MSNGTLRRLAAELRSLAAQLDELHDQSSLVHQHSIERAERLVCGELAATPALTTSRLRQRGRSQRLSSESISRALEQLHARFDSRPVLVDQSSGHLRPATKRSF
jgi:ribose 1,5-bisphosphokinase PhnN